MEPLGRSAIRKQILLQFLANSAFETHPREMARRIGRAAPPVVRELRALERRGILTSKTIGPLRRYRLAATPEAAAARQELSGASDKPDHVGRGHDARVLRLHARIAEKLRQDPETVLSKARANLVRWHEIDARGNEPWIQAWSELLDQGPAELAMAILEPGPRMSELRQSSPFAGVLTPQERLQVIRDGASEPAAG